VTRWARFWFGSLSLLLVVELWTVLNGAPGDTLSEQVMPLLENPTVHAVTLLVWLGFAGWLSAHWWGRRR